MTPQQVVAEARSWIGTPFVHDAEVKGAGVDCAHIVNAVFSTAGKIQSVKFPHYKQDWWKHATDPEQHIVENYKKLFREIPVKDVKPGDIVVMFLGKAWAHSAIVSEVTNGEVTRAIEAWPTRNAVAEINVREERLYRNHKKRYFTCF
ncbi:MAG: NlpC/P60 family protein [Candidatus Sulfotelmatobacter sp.]